MEKISVSIIAKNEEKKIKRCLESVKWADEIVLVDSGSTDKTKDICQEYKNLKFFETKWQGYGKTKQLASDKCSHSWILSIDADEALSLELQNKIKKILEKPRYKAYKIRRVSFYLNSKINFSGWRNDFVLRLFNKDFAHFNGKIVHESVQTKEKTSLIREPMWHYTIDNIDDHIKKMNNYTTLAAKVKFEKNKKASIFKAISAAFFSFIKRYFLNLGFLDGKAGFILSINSSYYTYLKYIKLWELSKK